MTQTSRPRVLLADDYPGILSSLERLLRTDCEIVASVRAGFALLEAAKRLKPDVAIVDLNLPEVNGLDACVHFMQDTPHTKVILLTADDSQAIRERAHQLGAEVVAKHHTVTLLLPAIQNAVR